MKRLDWNLIGATLFFSSASVLMLALPLIAMADTGSKACLLAYFPIVGAVIVVISGLADEWRQR